MATPTAPERPATTPAAASAMCLLHADYHPMAGRCWSATVEWFFAHGHLTDAEARDLYQADVERAMLDNLVRECAPWMVSD